jgi:hypothetical protein
VRTVAAVRLEGGNPQAQGRVLGSFDLDEGLDVKVDRSP